MNVNIAMLPTMYRWFTQPIMENPMNQLALSDLLKYVAESAVDTESEIDVIGPSAYLIGQGIPKETVDRFVMICGQEIRQFYMNNTMPEWRHWGRNMVQIDSMYNVFIQLGTDPYA